MATDMRKKIIKPIIIFVILIFLISTFAWIAVYFFDTTPNDLNLDQNTNYTWEEQSQDYQINVPKNLNINLSGNNQ